MARTLARVVRFLMVLVVTVSACQCDDTVDDGPPKQTNGDGDPTCGVDEVCDERCDGVTCEGGRECQPTPGSYACVCPEGTELVGGECVGDPCASLVCEGPGEACEVRGEAAVCGCGAGFHDVDGACVEDETCRESTCGGHGMCSETDAGVTCACEEGWSGEFCDGCDAAAGFVDDGSGGCTDDPCGATVCDPERVCVVQDEAAVCECAAGTHDDAGRCVTDTTCGPNSCNDHGQCSEAKGRISCACEAGWAAPFCQTCDAGAGYHDDGMGGCTTDVCLPNPCDEPHRSVCTANGTQAACGCDAGYHDNGSVCVADERCTATSCGDHGQCDDSPKEIVCACEAGYEGDACESCAAGYHDDGAGGCTTDVCLPNPCTAPNQSVCTSSGTTFTCACDADFHPDGAGGCTDDPCLPNLCAAQNQACRVTNDAPECYTPVCDDSNPCTDDTLVGGECQYSPVTDGTGCALDACTTGGSCQAGVCAGTAPLACDDGNPCTDDSCTIAAGGCVFAPDDANVPDDRVACTADSCAGGVPSHVADDGSCDDASWCSGVEVCAPLDAGADADGCVARDVPMPPPTRGPCEYYGACDDATQSFTLVTEAAGTACDDGIVCTSGDVCDGTGGCEGTLLATCPDTGTCASTVAFGPLNVEVAYLDLSVTYDGQDPVAAGMYGAFDIFAVGRENGAWHRIADYYGYSSTDTLDLGERLAPGVYDLLYLASTYSGESARTRFGVSEATRDIAYGVTYLERDVVLGAGVNVLTIDVPVADIAVSVTYDGQDPVAANLYGAFDIWAIEQETGGWHRIADYYGYSTPRQLERGDQLPVGTYDIVYLSSTYSGASAETIFSESNATTPDITYGRVVLQRDVVVSDVGQNAIVLDIPVGEVVVNVTYDGQDPVAANLYGAFDIWAVEQSSGAWHRVADYYGYSTPRELSTGTRLLPGTYDLMYVSSTYSGETATTHFGLTDGASRDIVYGRKYLARDVVVGSGATVLGIDVPVATIAPAVTYEGLDPATAGLYGSFDIWAVDQATGAWHRVADYYGYGSNDELQTGTHLLPGTYDLLYMATTYSGDSAFTHFGESNAGTAAIMYGSTFLQRDLVVTDDGANAFAVDVQEAAIAPSVTYNGADPAAASLYGAFDIWAVSQETGGWHRIADYYGYGSNDELTLGTRLPPGTYDVLYVSSTYSGASAYRYFDLDDGSPEVTYGTMVVQRGLVVSAGGANPIAIDIRPTAVSPVLTYEGQDPVASGLYGAFDVWAVARETDTWHRIVDYYGYSNPDELQYTQRLLPGVYDLVYLASTYSGDSAYTTFGISDSTSPDVVYGRNTLRACVLVP